MLFIVLLVVVFTAPMTFGVFAVCGLVASVTIGRAAWLQVSVTPSLVLILQLFTTVTDTVTSDEWLSAEAGRERTKQIAIADIMSEKKNRFLVWYMANSFHSTANSLTN
jgi:hypothetical protein